MEKIKAKVKLGLPLTEKERAVYLLFIATDEEIKGGWLNNGKV